MAHKTPTGAPDQHQDRLLTIKETAERLNLSRTALYEWRQAGHGPRSISPPGRTYRYVRYRASDIDAWLDENTTGPSKATA